MPENQIRWATRLNVVFTGIAALGGIAAFAWSVYVDLGDAEEASRLAIQLDDAKATIASRDSRISQIEHDHRELVGDLRDQVAIAQSKAERATLESMCTIGIHTFQSIAWTAEALLFETRTRVHPRLIAQYLATIDRPAFEALGGEGFERRMSFLTGRYWADLSRYASIPEILLAQGQTAILAEQAAMNLTNTESLLDIVVTGGRQTQRITADTLVAATLSTVRDRGPAIEMMRSEIIAWREQASPPRADLRLILDPLRVDMEWARASSQSLSTVELTAEQAAYVLEQVSSQLNAHSEAAFYLRDMADSVLRDCGI